MTEKKLVFQNGAEIEFSPSDRPEKIRGHNPPIVWEVPWTEEQVERMNTYFLHDEQCRASLCLISTPRDNWLVTWWGKMVASDEKADNDEG